MKGKWTTLKLLLYFSLLRLADLAFPPATSDEKTKDRNGHSNDPWLTACTFVMGVPPRFIRGFWCGSALPSPSLQFRFCVVASKIKNVHLWHQSCMEAFKFYRIRFRLYPRLSIFGSQSVIYCFFSSGSFPPWAWGCLPCICPWWQVPGICGWLQGMFSGCVVHQRSCCSNCFICKTSCAWCHVGSLYCKWVCFSGTRWFCVVLATGWNWWKTDS